MNGPIRSFIALDLPRALAKEVEDLLFSLKKTGADVSWVRPSNLHFTLKFLGNVPPDRLPTVAERLAAVVSAQKPFFVQCACLGGFPDMRRPKVLWIGVKEGENFLKALAGSVESAMAGIGFAREEREFSAHLTIGRVKGGKGLENLSRELKRLSFVSSEKWPVDHLTLYKSILTSQGAVYESIGSFAFGG